MSSWRTRPTSRQMALEVAVFSSHDAVLAERMGASRLELNAGGSYAVGGLTPNVSELLALKGRRRVPISIMIRPHATPTVGRDFIYTAAEVALMARDIRELKKSGGMDAALGDRFVFGAVRETADGRGDVEVDEAVCAELLDAARPFPCVFHRALDGIAARDKAVRRLGRLGFAAVLTAGGDKGGCAAHADVMDALCCRAPAGMQIIAGGGLRAENARALAQRLAVHDDERVAMHTAAAVWRDGRWEMDTDELLMLVMVLDRVEPA